MGWVMREVTPRLPHELRASQGVTPLRREWWFQLSPPTSKGSLLGNLGVCFRASGRKYIHTVIISLENS